MERSRISTISSLIAILLLLHCSAIFTAAVPARSRRGFLQTSCNTTTYPRLCYRILRVYADEIDTSPKLLAYAALNVTLKAVNNTSRMMRRLARIGGLRHGVAAAVADCIELVGDSVDEVRDSMAELRHVRPSNFTIVVSDVQTWVSAALTDEDTCMDGFEGRGMGGNVKMIVRKRILKISRFTSVALALVNNFASTHPKRQ